MRTFAKAVLVLASVSAATAGAVERRAQALKAGETAPLTDLKMKSTTGKDVSIASEGGKKGTLVVFSCIGCPFVKAWDNRLTALGHEAKTLGLGVLFINSNNPGVSPGDSFEAMQGKAKDQAYQFPFAVDPESRLAAAFGAGRTPEVFLLDPKGKVAYHGAVDDNSQDADKVQDHYLRDAIQSLAKGQEIKVKDTKSIGCGIKFP